MRHEVMDYMFKKPSMLDDLDVTFKTDSVRKVLFYYQVKSLDSVVKSLDYHI